MEYNLLLKIKDESMEKEVLDELINFLDKKYAGKVVAEPYRRINLTVDILIKYKSGIVLIKRKNEPYKDYWAVTGGFVEYGERVEEAAKREAKEETGLDIDNLKLIGVYSDPSRDSRGHTVTVAFLADGIGTLKSGSDAKDARICNLDELNEIDFAFDHKKLIDDSIHHIFD
ncbi:8-oxo-dGTP diphosphatase [Methanococcus maripaludis]|uniref:8-oxo-dGTP diphosphatase n=1 Tax=Methanococcus maripaludis TaxID=39152 RepID=A0A7J9NZN8_METMI|nr:NUDIX hydrolase [Methanococcus maripaludis]MBA2853139.1 8-oxo-dGTP diphosphatase [Methanococcus maripaludis]